MVCRWSLALCRRSDTMPPQPAWPYKRPFYQATLSKHEIQVWVVAGVDMGVLGCGPGQVELDTSRNELFHFFVKPMFAWSAARCRKAWRKEYATDPRLLTVSPLPVTQSDISYILSQTKREPRQPGRFQDSKPDRQDGK